MFPLLPLWGLKSILRKKGAAQLQSAQKLRSKYIHISNGLIRTGEIVAKLFQSEVLTSRERDDIQQLLSTPIRANEQLLNILMLKDDKAYDCFIRTLCNTGQKHVADILFCGDKYLNTEHSLMIQRNYSTLVDNLDVDCGNFLDRLYESGALIGREMETINAKPTQREKNEVLLDLASKFSTANFDHFLEALEKSSQGHVSSIITGRHFDESKGHFERFGVKEKFRYNSKLQSDSNLDSRDQQEQTVHHRPTIIEASFLLRRPSVKTLRNKFSNLPEELQNELSLKVAVLHQKTVQPAGTNVELCIRKLIQGFIQEKKEAKRKHCKVEDVPEIPRRINDPENQLDDIFKTEIQLLNEELLLHKSKNQYLNEMLKTKVNELDKEKQKSTELEVQLKRNSNESVSLLRQIDELRKELSESLSLVDANKTEISTMNKKLIVHRADNRHLDEKWKTTLIELDNEKQRSSECERQLEHRQREAVNLQQTIDELQRQLGETIRLVDENKEKFEALLREKDHTMSEFQQKRDQETKEWTDEKEHLMNQIQELLNKEYSENKKKSFNPKEKRRKETKRNEQLVMELAQQENILFAEQQYKSEPVLVKTIRVNSDEKKKPWFRTPDESKDIRGLTILDKELFVVCEKSSEVEVYDWIKFTLSRRWNCKKLIDPTDIGSCKRNQCLYIFDCRVAGRSSEIFRVDKNGNLLSKWSTGHHDGWGLSVTDESNLISTIPHENKLNEFSPEGQLIREIDLSIVAGIRHPWHAIKLTNGDFVVSQSPFLGDGLHRVCIVDSDGQLRKSFGEKSGSTSVQMNRPVYFAVDGNGYVMVADCNNSRVLLLNSNLELRKEILSKVKHGLQRPQRILLDESNGQLFVADNESGNQRILIFAFNN